MQPGNISAGAGFSFAIAFSLAAGLPPSTPAFQPALLNSPAELELIKSKVEAGIEPWKAGFEAMRSSPFASLDFVPKPRETVECGHYHKPDFGCSDETSSSRAAYAHALMWALTGKPVHAAKAAEILDAWSARLKRHTNKNAPLQAAWNGAVFPRAALILRNTYPAWDRVRQARLSGLFDSAFLPLIRNGNPNPNGNWELTYVEALMAIGVFNGDSAAYLKGVALWRERVPAYFYLRSDGPLPVKPAHTARYDHPDSLARFWHRPGLWPDGLCQETCRDLQHMQMGLGALINAAEIAWHQGLDLYSEEALRITTAMEFHAGLLLGQAPPAGLCGGPIESGFSPTWEVAYNHYHNRMGHPLPLTRKWIAQMARPSESQYHMNWETLTHAELGGGRVPAMVAIGYKAGRERTPKGRPMGFASGMDRSRALPWLGGLYAPDGSRLPEIP